MKCARCGAAVTGSSAFCSACGTLVSDPAAATVSVAQMADFEKTHTPTMQQPDDLLELVRTELGKDYQVEMELGRGGMAVVYRAKEIELGRSVAIKVLPPEMALTASMAERFKREARMAASLDHPNIIPIYRVGSGGKLFYIAMKFVRGRALDAIIEQQGALPISIVVQVLRGAAHALAYAHERGIVHRDIKGANIMIQTDGRPVVSDFGIARGVTEKTMTAAGSVIGTPYYMSPEQCAGSQVGPPSDQYSLGVVGFQMLTGAVPFDADSLPAILQHHWFTPVPDITAVRQDVPEELVELINKAMAKKPEERFATTDEMARALDLIRIPEPERQAGDAMLRELASGKTAPKVRTNSLPPLSSTMQLSGSRTGPTAAMRRARRKMMLGVGAGVLAVAVGIGIWYSGALRTANEGIGVQASSSANPVVAAPPTPVDTKSSDVTKTAPLSASSAGTATPVSAEDAKAAETKRLERARRDSVARARRDSIAQARRDAAAAAPTGTGRIRLRTDPSDAQIIIDGRVAGRGVLVDHDLSAGTHRLRITSSGYVTFDTTITVRAGETTALGRRTLTPQQP